MKQLFVLILLLVTGMTYSQNDTEATPIKKAIKKEKGKFGIKVDGNWLVPAAYDKITGIEFNSYTPSHPVNSYYYKGWKGEKFDLLFVGDPGTNTQVKIVQADVEAVKYLSSSLDKSDQEYVFFRKNGKWGWFIRKAQMLKMEEEYFLENYTQEARFDKTPEIQLLYHPSNYEHTEFSNINFMVDSAGLTGLFGLDGKQIFKFGPYARFKWNERLKIFSIKGTNDLEGYAFKGKIVEPQYTSIQKSDNIAGDYACVLPDGKKEYRIGADLVNERSVASGQKLNDMLAESEAKRQAENAKKFEMFYDEQSHKFGFKDANGKIVCQPKYDILSNRFGDLHEAWIDDKHGFVDEKGTIVIPIKYEHTRVFFSEGLVAVQLNGKWGFIDKTDKVVIPFQFELANNFVNGVAEVIWDGRITYINKAGKEVK